MLGFVRNFFAAILLVVSALAIGFTGAFAEQRIALVVGNSSYESISSLVNPKNDAELMAATLREVGFEVVSAFDADYRGMSRAVKSFGKKLRAAGDDTVGLFYYAGHGVQANGTNYLIPLGTEIDAQSDLDLEALNAADILRQMESAGNRLNLVILDACRNNPFKGQARSSIGGLARMNAARGSLIAFATGPGQVAADGVGRNSPYTQALVEAIKQPGLAVEQVFKRARVNVGKKTKKRQTPWEESSLEGDFFFVPQNRPVVNQTVAPNAKPDSSDVERVYNQIKDSESVKVLEIFVNRYSDSIYAEFVRVRIATLKKAIAAAIQPIKEGLQISPTPDAAKEDNSIVTSSLSQKDLTRSVQVELNRMGCVPGIVDGVWGDGSRNALKEYQNSTGIELSSLEPTGDLLNNLKTQKSPLCPLVCPGGYKLENAQCQPTSALSKITSKECKDYYQKFKKRERIRAFAVSANGIACGASWRFETKKLATDAALESCNKQGRGKCSVVEISNPSNESTSDDCKKGYITWDKQAGFKVFAISGTGGACGWSYGMESRAQAVEAALKGCQERSKGCHVIATVER